MNVAYLLALLMDFGVGLEKALEGLEQSARWDTLKTMQAQIEAAKGEAEKLVDALEDVKAKNNALVGEVDELDVGLREKSEAFDQLQADFQKLTVRADELQAALDAALAAAKPVEPVAEGA